VERELVLLKVNAKTENRAEILRITDIFRGQVVDVGLEHYTISITGDAHKVRAILNLLKPFGIREIARTGSIAMFRENQAK
jgi:acetolactate synthase-1/3 small subunit